MVIVTSYELFDRWEFEDGVQADDCTPTSPEHYRYLYHWKLKMSFPDGAIREFRPAGLNDVLHDGYFNVNPNGLETTCWGGSHYASTSGMTYYSTDGSYMRLFIPHDGTAVYEDNFWTLYMPDGTRVTGGGPANQNNQRIYDRNENYIEIGNVTINGQVCVMALLTNWDAASY